MYLHFTVNDFECNIYAMMHACLHHFMVLHKKTPLRFGASDFGETPVWGMKFSWNSGSFVLRWSGVKSWYIRMNLTLEPECHFKTSNHYDTDCIAGQSKTKKMSTTHLNLCDVLSIISPSWIAFSSNGSKTPRGIVMPGSYGFICRKEIRHRSKRTSELQKVIWQWTCHAHRRGIIMCLADGPDRGSRKKGS